MKKVILPIGNHEFIHQNSRRYKRGFWLCLVLDERLSEMAWKRYQLNKSNFYDND